MISHDVYHRMHHVTLKFASQYKTNPKPGPRFKDILMIRKIADMLLIIVVLASVAFTGKYIYTFYSSQTGYCDIVCIIVATAMMYFIISCVYRKIFLVCIVRCYFLDVHVILNIESKSTGCACPRIYIPLCGEDGVTYDNECTMNCT